jgi:hypothetical protein
MYNKYTQNTIYNKYILVSVCKLLVEYLARVMAYLIVSTRYKHGDTHSCPLNMSDR